MDHLAPEILDSILTLASKTPDEGSLWTRLAHRNKSLLSFALVCRGWTGVAQDLLWRDVRLPARATPLSLQVQEFEGPEQEARPLSDWQLFVNQPKTGYYTSRRVSLTGMSAEAVASVLASRLRGVMELDISELLEWEGICIAALAQPSLKLLKKLTLEDTQLTDDWQDIYAAFPEGGAVPFSIPFKLETLIAASTPTNQWEPARPVCNVPPVLISTSFNTLQHLHLDCISTNLHEALALVMPSLCTFHFPAEAATMDAFLPILTKATHLISLSLIATTEMHSEQLVPILEALPSRLNELSVAVCSARDARVLSQGLDVAPSCKSLQFLFVTPSLSYWAYRDEGGHLKWARFAVECEGRAVACSLHERLLREWGRPG